MNKPEVITGPMFSGKTDELIRRIKLARIAGLRVMGIKPKRDSREKDIVSHKINGDGTVFEDASSYPAFEVERPEELEDLIREHKPDLLGVDEAQFLSHDFVGFFKKLLESEEYSHLRIIIAGLNMTSEGYPFGPMPEFIALADAETRLKAVCFRCKEYPPTATMSFYKKGEKDNPVEVGGVNIYEARCRKCWEPPKPKLSE
jgi:thymidine kinase